MSEKTEITFMQTRLIRLASEEWHLPVEQIICLFKKADVLGYIEKCYGIFLGGICLIYSFLDVLEKIKHSEGMSIMPVMYVDNRDKYKDICLNHNDLLEFNDETESKYQLTCTTKEKLSYSFEEEWRLIYEREKVDKDGKKIGDCISFINPTVIICGNSVDKNSLDYQRLIRIAEEKEIRVI